VLIHEVADIYQRYCGYYRSKSLSGYVDFFTVSDIFKGSIFVRYVGEIKGFSNAKMLVIFKDTY